MFESPAESREVGRAEPLFSGAFQEVEPPGELLLAFPDDGGRAVGRPVVDDEHFERFLEREDLRDHRRDILLFVVGRNDYELAHGRDGFGFGGKYTIILPFRPSPPCFFRHV